MEHGFVSTDGGRVQQPPLLRTVGLTSTGRPYHFQGKMKDIVKYMNGPGSTIGLRVTPDRRRYPDHNWSYLVVDIYKVSTSAAEAYRRAVVAAVPGVNILGALISAAKSKKVIIKLRYGFTAPPENTNHTRIHIELPATGSSLRNLAMALDGSRKVNALSVANIGVSTTKTVIKILTKGIV